MTYILIAAWVGFSLLAVLLGLLLLVGNALRAGGREKPGLKAAGSAFLKPALLFGLTDPVACVVVSWLVWAALGSAVIWLLRAAAA
jgi:hypothetical protein